MVYYCDLTIRSFLMVTLEIIFMKTFLVMGLVWQFLFFPKIETCTFIVIALTQNFVTVLPSRQKELYRLCRYHKLKTYVPLLVSMNIMFMPHIRQGNLSIVWHVINKYYCLFFPSKCFVFYKCFICYYRNCYC